uniref:Uncharacterized protein n=1 Tax=Anguilla anguilla TaxID=7936 RepID=A0A0E9PNT1_ANGAN
MDSLAGIMQALLLHHPTQRSWQKDRDGYSGAPIP